MIAAVTDADGGLREGKARAFCAAFRPLLSSSAQVGLLPGVGLALHLSSASIREGPVWPCALGFGPLPSPWLRSEGPGVARYLPCALGFGPH